MGGRDENWVALGGGQSGEFMALTLVFSVGMVNISHSSAAVSLGFWIDGPPLYYFLVHY